MEGLEIARHRAMLRPSSCGGPTVTPTAYWLSAAMLLGACAFEDDFFIDPNYGKAGTQQVAAPSSAGSDPSTPVIAPTEGAPAACSAKPPE